MKTIILAFGILLVASCNDMGVVQRRPTALQSTRRKHPRLMEVPIMA